jgi:16S rRNA (uracil1498-N3)-methyltransferase
MNLLLLTNDDFIGDGIAEIGGWRREHIINILKLTEGGHIKTGLINGQIGVGVIVHASQSTLKIEVDLRDDPQPNLPVKLLLALPRPKMVKRILQTCACLGVADLYLINSYRVEKSYWQSPCLDTKSVQEQLLLGLQQAGTTIPTRVHLRKRFKPFVEDELENIAGNSLRLVGHPKSESSVPLAINQPVTLAIGPEAGFISYEVDGLIDRGFTPVSLGNRILKVEVAIVAFLSRLYT